MTLKNVITSRSLCIGSGIDQTGKQYSFSAYSGAGADACGGTDEAESSATNVAPVLSIKVRRISSLCMPRTSSSSDGAGAVPLKSSSVAGLCRFFGSLFGS